MRLSVPAFIFAAFAAVATGVLATGSWLAQRQIVERVERDRGSHEQLAAEFAAELQRLEALYETHLRRLLAIAREDPEPVLFAACRNLVGVRHFSRLHTKRGRRDLQLDCRPAGAQALPIPVFPRASASAGISRRELTPEHFIAPNSARGAWLREPGQPALFFVEAEDAFDVLTIDESEVRAVIDAWLARWLPSAFAPVAAADSADRILAPDKTTFIESSRSSEPHPDWVLPIRSQIGTWRIESWDRRVVRQEWHLPTLAGAIGLAVLLLGTGLALAARVRRERHFAEQRVSFVNRVSHELRSPLTNILLHLDIAAEQIAEPEPAARLELAREAGARLGRLIDNVLAFSQQERGRVEIQPRACVPATVVREVLEQFAPAFQRRGITVQSSLDSAQACQVDPEALSQIVANLLSNLEKYVPAGTARVNLRFEGSELVLLVSDDGPGIPPSAADRVFLPFERLDSRTTEGVTGTGLGLAIARELALHMGGTLQLLSNSKGAAFELRIPAPPVEELRASTAA